MARSGKRQQTAKKAQVKGSSSPTIIAFVVILALIGGFALINGGFFSGIAPASSGQVKAPGPGDAPVTGQAVEKAATLDGSVQRITVDPSGGVYDPNVIVAKAGVPLEIQFKPGTGCLAAVLFPKFSIQQDIQSGAVVKLPKMEPGEVPFSCGMKMVFGKIIVR